MTIPKAVIPAYLGRTRQNKVNSETAISQWAQDIKIVKFGETRPFVSYEMTPILEKGEQRNDRARASAHIRANGVS